MSGTPGTAASATTGSWASGASSSGRCTRWARPEGRVESACDAGPCPRHQRRSTRQLETADAECGAAGGIDHQSHAVALRPSSKETLTSPRWCRRPDPDLERDCCELVERRRTWHEDMGARPGRLVPRGIITVDCTRHRILAEARPLGAVVAAAQAGDIRVKHGLGVFDAQFEFDLFARPDAKLVPVSQDRNHDLRSLRRSQPSSAGGRRNVQPRRGL